jgi:hypothetical protein
MTDTIVPTVDSLVGPAIDALIAARPTALRHIETGGVWTHIIEEMRAQARLEVLNIAKQVARSRLPLSSGDDLKELVASEYAPIPDSTPLKAVGEVRLLRSTSTTRGVIQRDSARSPVRSGFTANNHVRIHGGCTR